VNAASERHLEEVYPELARRARSAAANAEQGQSLWSVEFDRGIATWPQQAALWALGRDAQGNTVDPAKVVTHARPGESYHCYALALDFFILQAGVAVWNVHHEGYAKMIDASEQLGLVSGSRWPEPKTDFDHLQCTGGFPENKPDDHCKYLFTEGGFVAVFKEVDRVLGIA
jgi:hypothetical protein